MSSQPSASTLSQVLQGPRVRLRPAEEEDIPTLVSLRNEAREQFFDSREVTEASTLQWLKTSRARGELYWVIEFQGGVAGTISATPSQRGLEVGRMIIHPTLRGQGLMEEVLRFLLPHLAARYAAPVFLEVKPDNHTAIRLYEKVGFVPTRLRMDWKDDPPL